ncbi:glycosyltransferase [Vibrio sp. Isolate33]|uniref:glycosyltransferase n=1 Tax=Vibrio sp. Isolate33 TaxID=2908539 RepID=UPI001EFDD874|nr:glycosyltransferase [Vibrio sp. Isolate33]MCG9544450.1 glycosyltransferase [Vibrio sp. Isolate33]
MNFSVLMSLYHREQPNYFNDAMRSLFEQTVKPNEVVIVHDGPLNKGLYDVIDAWSLKLNIVQVVLPENRGLGIALNAGLKACKYDLIARVDTDDINERNRFELQLLEFENSINLAVCGSNIKEVNCSDLSFISNRNVPESHCEIMRTCIKRNPFNHMTVMFKKEVVQAVGNYMDMTSMEDWYLWIRILAKNYECTNIQKDLVKARTGLEMMQRRSGFKYIGYEFSLTRKKMALFPERKLLSIRYFFLRSIPRLLPKPVLAKVYLLTRREV